MPIVDNGQAIVYIITFLFILVVGERHSSKNLISNGQFDINNKATGFVKSWSCQGGVNSPVSANDDDAYPVLRTMKYFKSKPFAGLCTQRTSVEQGPSQDITSKIDADQIYRLQAWTKLLKGKSRDENSAIELWVRWKSEDESEKEEKKLLGLRHKLLRNDDWVFWNTQFHLPAVDAFDYVIVYFRGPPSHVDIVVDSVVLEHIPQIDNWREHFDESINNVRKRDVVLRIEFPENDFSELELITSAYIEVKQVSSDFGFGVSVHHDAIKHDLKYRSFIKENFEWATMEHALKWNYIEATQRNKPLSRINRDKELESEKQKLKKVENVRSWSVHAPHVIIVLRLMQRRKYFFQGVVNYTRSDEMLDILQDNMRMKVRGHCIFWAVPDEQPAWLTKTTPSQLQGAMKKRLYDVLHRYKHRINIWDVNNEMLHGSFYSDVLNQNIRDWMYYEAHKIFPKGKLFVNDYEVLAAPWYTQSYVEQIREFQERGIPIHGIGIQGHFGGLVHPEILKERLDNLAVLGLPIWITELDAVVENDAKRAAALEKIMRVAYAHPAVHGIVLWTFWDKHAWKKKTALFTGHDFEPNEAGLQYLQLRKQWKTDISGIRPVGVSRNSCTFRFRAHHGIHSLRVHLPDGSLLTKTVQVSNHPGEVTFVFHSLKTHQVSLKHV